MTNDEEWRNIPNFLNYQASNLGRIRNAKTFYVLKQKLNNRRGYKSYIIGLYSRGKQIFVSVHRLILITFVGMPPSLNYECCHSDGNSLNNKLSNLRWGTKSDNELDCIKLGSKRGMNNGRSILTDNDVIDIRLKYNLGASRLDLSKEYNIDRSQIGRIITKKHWKHI